MQHTNVAATTRNRFESEVNLGCTRTFRPGRPSPRTATVGIHFGIPLFDVGKTILERTPVRMAPGRIVLLVGPSGSGKTTVMNHVERRFAGGCRVDRITFPHDTAIIDAVAPWGSLSDALATLTGCGLGDAHLWIRPFLALSEGEKFRARLARAVALHGRSTPPAPLLCDEFCSTLHRRAAKAISFSLRRIATRQKLTLALACSNEDLVPDLQPDTLVRLNGTGRATVESPRVLPRKPFTLRRRMRIEPGRKRDYNVFASMHYRPTDELGFVDKVFVLRDGPGGLPVRIVVYAHPPLELAMRNRATKGRFTRDPQRLNRSMRILRRLVIHPDLRGTGLGHYLVAKTLPLVGTEYVECLATMGEFNPVFEKAGMRRIGQYELAPDRMAALDALRDMDVDPNGRDFVAQVARQRRVRHIVASVVYAWYAATTADGKSRVKRQSAQFLAHTFRGLVGSRPVYYLWRKNKAV